MIHTSPTPARLTVARLYRGRTKREVAQALEVSPAALTQYEKGQRRPSEDVLTELARVLEFPVRFFGRPSTLMPLKPNYRSLSSVSQKLRNSVEAAAVLFEDFVERVCELAEVSIAPPTVPDLGRLSPEDAARDLRRQWYLPEGPVENVVALLEEHGVLVRLLHPRDRQIDAFSYWTGERPHVVLNPAKADPYRSRFDAAHELGHLVRDRSDRELSHRELEQEANRFAAEFLVPGDEWQYTTKPPPGVTSPRAHLRAKAKWKVSIAALLYRSRATRRLSEPAYRSAMVQYSRSGFRRGEPSPWGRPIPHEVPTLLARVDERLIEQGVDVESIRDELGLPRDAWTEFRGFAPTTGRRA